eukprot:Amastigsp_a185197_4.p2 type:complete len:184 gc:universal Amastigsp_a185197_4:585-34(-)
MRRSTRLEDARPSESPTSRWQPLSLHPPREAWRRPQCPAPDLPARSSRGDGARGRRESGSSQKQLRGEHLRRASRRRPSLPTRTALKSPRTASAGVPAHKALLSGRPGRAESESWRPPLLGEHRPRQFEPHHLVNVQALREHPVRSTGTRASHFEQASIRPHSERPRRQSCTTRAGRSPPRPH